MKGHIRERGPKTWAIIVDLPRSADGKRRRHWETVHGAKRDAQRRLREVLTEIDSRSYVAPQRITVGQALTDWLDALTVAPKTAVRYREIVEHHICPALAAIPLQRLTAATIEKLYREKRAGGRADGRPGGLSERTLLHIHRVLSEALKRAVRLRLIPRNPCNDVDSPRPRRAVVEVLDEAQTVAVLDAARGSRIYAPALVAVTTGLRLGEILGLRWQDVDIGTRTLAVRQTLQRVNRELGVRDMPKTRSSVRTIALPAMTADCLREHKARQIQVRLRNALVWQDSGLVFCTEDGRPLPPDSISREFSALARALGFRVTFHGLRHSHATHLLRAGVPMKVTSGRLGHSGIAITADTYSHLLADAQTDAAQKIDDALSGVSRNR